MAVASHAPVGFAGTVDEAGEARRFSLPSARFRVQDAASWAVISVTTSSLTVQIAAGVAECCGVWDFTNSPSTLTLATNSSGSTRLDAIVARWTWGSTPSVAFAVLTGTPGATNPPTPTRNPGVVYEAILAVVSVTSGMGAIPTGNVYDIRVYGGYGGPFIIPQGGYAYVDLPDGSQLTLGSASGPLYQQIGGSLVYAAPPGGELGYAARTSQAGPVTTVTAISGLSSTFTLLGSRKVLFAASGQATSDAAGTVVGIRINVDGTAYSASTVTVVAANAGQFVFVRCRLALAAGTHTATVELSRYGGTGGAYLTADLAELTVTDMGS